jgi:hypothetical protein
VLVVEEFAVTVSAADVARTIEALYARRLAASTTR